MPNCFTLTPKGEKAPASFQEIDNKLREHFHQPPSDTEWLWGWYDTIGLARACGKYWEWIKNMLQDENLTAVANWLEGRYDVDSWRER